MQTVYGDYNRLGLDKPNAIPLGDEGRLREQGITLQEGERVLVVEPDELEAVGIAYREWSDGWGMWFWSANLDMSTLHSIGRALEMQQ